MKPLGNACHCKPIFPSLHALGSTKNNSLSCSLVLFYPPFVLVLEIIFYCYILNLNPTAILRVTPRLTTLLVHCIRIKNFNKVLRLEFIVFYNMQKKVNFFRVIKEYVNISAPILQSFSSI